jgi:hypothetical protein
MLRNSLRNLERQILLMAGAWWPALAFLASYELLQYLPALRGLGPLDLSSGTGVARLVYLAVFFLFFRVLPSFLTEVYEASREDSVLTPYINHSTAD